MSKKIFLTIFIALAICCATIFATRVWLTFSCKYAINLTEQVSSWASYQTAVGQPIYSQDYLKGPYANIICYAPFYFWVVGSISKFVVWLSNWNTFHTTLIIGRIISIAAMTMLLLILSRILQSAGVRRPYNYLPFLIVALVPQALRVCVQCTTDTLPIFFELALIYVALTFSDKKIIIPAIGFLGFAALMTRLTSFVGLIIILVYACFNHRERSKLLYGILLSVILFDLIFVLLLKTTGGACLYSMFFSQGKNPFLSSWRENIVTHAFSTHIFKISALITVCAFFVTLLSVLLIRLKVPFEKLRNIFKFFIFEGPMRIILIYSFAWLVFAYFYSGKVWSGTNYFMPAIFGCAACIVFCFHKLFAMLPRKSTIPLACLLFLIAAKDVYGNIKPLKNHADSVDYINTTKSRLAREIKNYKKVFTKQSDVLCSQGKTTYMVDPFTICMAQKEGWFSASNIYEYVEKQYYDCVFVELHCLGDSPGYYWLPGLAFKVQKYYYRNIRIPIHFLFIRPKKLMAK